MPTRHRVALWLLCVVLTPLAAAAQARTEQTLLDLIVSEGPQARAIRAAADAARREQEARVAWPNPGVGYSREGAGTTEFYQVEQSIPLFGSRGALARAGVAAAEAADAERDARLWHLRAEATVAIARYQIERERLTLARATIADIERLIDILRTREREGEGSRFDRLRAEHEVVDVRMQAVSAEVAAAEARAALAALLPEGVLVPDLPGEPFRSRDIPAIEALVARAVQSRADLRALERASQRFLLEADAARRARLPSPTVAAGIKRGEIEEGRTATGGLLGVRVTLPLFDTGARDVARWRAEQSRAEAERVALLGEIRAQLSGAAQSAALRQQAVTSMESAVTSAEELAGIADVAYRDGEVGILEVLDARRVAARARQRVVDARLDARLAQIALMRTMGETLWP
jgi:cobalt-zinc-cadmium efflux system outer membrane protein